MWSVPNHFAVFTTRLLGSINPIERPFTPDKTRDLSTVWKRQGVDQITPDTRRLAKPKALMFFHMPLYVFSLVHIYRSDVVWNIVASARKVIPRPIPILRRESLMNALESSHLARGVYREVKVVANGHSHGTLVSHHDLRRLKLYLRHNRELSASKGHWMCFSSGGYV